MFRQAFAKLSGTHLTILALGAMFIPSSLWAVAAYQTVILQDASSSYKARIDSNGEVGVHDDSVQALLQVEDYGRNPGYVFSTYTVPTANSTSCQTAFTNDSTFGAVITNVTTSTYGANAEGITWAYACGESVVAIAISGLSYDTFSNDLGSGFYVPPGSSVYVQSPSGTASITIHGYRIPGSAFAKLHQQTAAWTPRRSPLLSPRR